MAAALLSLGTASRQASVVAASPEAVGGRGARLASGFPIRARRAEGWRGERGRAASGTGGDPEHTLGRLDPGALSRGKPAVAGGINPLDRIGAYPGSARPVDGCLGASAIRMPGVGRSH